MERELAVPFALANMIGYFNNRTIDECKANLKCLNAYWEKLSESEQEEYCSSFNVAKEALHDQIKFIEKNGPISDEYIEEYNKYDWH